MKLPTYGELREYYCSHPTVPADGGVNPNPFHEVMANRRYNCSPSLDTSAIRLVFLQGASQTPVNRTLNRNGRFIWCKDLRYEGRGSDGWRHISFSVDKGSKRFTAGENNILCIPSKMYVNNNRYFRNKHTTFSPFSTVFSYAAALRLLSKSHPEGRDSLEQMIAEDNPFKPGTLVSPRRGYFYPSHDASTSVDNSMVHPCGIVLARTPTDDYIAKELYRVRFGDTTYERIHPVQLEIINEV